MIRLQNMSNHRWMKTYSGRRNYFRRRSNRVYTLNPSQEPRIREELEKGGFSFMDSQYAFWRAVDGETTVTFFKTGKLVVQGRDMEEIINYLKGTRVIAS